MVTQQEWWQCPYCAADRPAFAFHLVGRFEPGLQFAGKRRCPGCDQITGKRALRRSAHRVLGSDAEPAVR
jgi:hypothetical protein